MDAAFFTALSGLMVSVSGVYYAVLVWNRKAPGNPLTWVVWAVIGVALFITSNTTFGLNAMTFGMVNPIAISAIAIYREFAEAKIPTKREIVSGLIGLAAIVAWWFVRADKSLSEWTLLLAITADCVPLWPVVRGAWDDPTGDKPLPWALAGFGFGVGGFGLTELSVYTLALPVYMFFGANAVTLPLALHRLRTRAPLREWV